MENPVPCGQYVQYVQYIQHVQYVQYVQYVQLTFIFASSTSWPMFTLLVLSTCFFNSSSNLWLLLVYVVDDVVCVVVVVFVKFNSFVQPLPLVLQVPDSLLCLLHLCLSLVLRSFPSFFLLLHKLKKCGLHHYHKYEDLNKV